MNEFSSDSETVLTPLSDTDRLEQILENQQLILSNQKQLLKAERNRHMWGIIKIIFIALLVLVPLFLLPMMMSSMTEGILGDTSGGMNLDAILGNPDALEQLLMGQ